MAGVRDKSIVPDERAVRGWNLLGGFDLAVKNMDYRNCSPRASPRGGGHNSAAYTSFLTENGSARRFQGSRALPWGP
jgi:hypothetical protein